MRPNTFEIKKIAKWKGFSGRSSTIQSVHSRSAMRATKEELRQTGQIAAGKPFMLRRKFCDPKFAPLDRMWSAEDTYLDLAASAADATEHF